MSQQSIAQRMRMLGCSLENAAPEPIVPEEQPPIVDSQVDLDSTEVIESQAAVSEAEGVLDQLQADHGELSEVASALESFLAQPGDLSPFLVQALAIPARRATRPYGLTNSIPSMESVGESPTAVRTALRASLEATEGRMAQLIKWIKEVFKVMLEKAVNMWKSFTDYTQRLKDQAGSFVNGVYAKVLADLPVMGNKVSQIQLSANEVAALSLKGSYAGDVAKAYGPVGDLADAQLIRWNPEMIEAQSDGIMIVRDMMHQVSKDASEETLTAVMQQLGELVQNSEKAMGEVVKKTENIMAGVHYDGTTATFPELLGGWVLKIGVSESGNVEVQTETVDVQSEELTIDPLTPEQIKSLGEQVYKVCDIIISYHADNKPRKTAIAQMEELIKEASSMKSDDENATQFMRGLVGQMSGALKGVVAVERPLITYLSRVNKAALSLCHKSYAAYTKGAQNLGLPAPAKA